MSRILTLNIGASKAVLAEYLLGGKGRLTLTGYGSGELPAVDVNDIGSLGATLPQVLRQIMREKDIRPAPLVVSLGGQMVFPRFAKCPPVGELEQQVRYEIEENVPFPIDEIVSDYQFLGSMADGDKAVMIVAAKVEAVRAVTDAVRAAGLKPAVVDVSPVAICNALKAAYPQLDGCSVVLDIGSKTTNLMILEGEKIYNRSIPIAGNTITKEIAQQFGCSFEEAEQVKRERGYVALGGVTEDEDEVTDRISKIIRTVLTRLHAEISRSINFYRSQQGGSAPTRLFLTGGTARLPQLDQFFMDALQVDVQYLNPFGSVAFGPKIDQDQLEGDAFALSESVGLALRGGDGAWISINLLPPELVNEARAMKRIPFLVAGGVAFLAALGVGVVLQSGGVERAKAKLERVESRNQALKSLDVKLKAEQKAEMEERAKCDDFQQLIASRSAALRRVKDVRGSLLGGMWITEWKSIPASKDKPDSREAVQLTVRGWRDVMEKAEARLSADSDGKGSTVAEIVMAKIKRSVEFVPESVKITSQRSVEGCLTEFSIQMDIAPSPSIVPEAEKGRKGKGSRR
jgi:type IV pilus assembly protein PilM